MKLTRERALELHRQMWTDMQKDLGDNPARIDRVDYKLRWLVEHFPKEFDDIENNCFLCEYERQRDDEDVCVYGWCECLIEWPDNFCEGSPYCDTDKENRWDYMPISKLLALPEREDVE